MKAEPIVADFELTVIWRAKWWQRPIRWLCGQPNTVERKFNGCNVVGFDISLAEPGMATVNVTMNTIQFDSETVVAALGFPDGSRA